MDAEAVKRELLAAMHETRAEWEALIAQLDPQRMEQQGVEGDWSAKDLIAHVEIYERWMGMLINAGGPNIPHETDGMRQDQLNAWIYQHNRDRSPAEVLRASRASFEQLVAAVESLPLPDLVAPDKFEWTGGRPVYQVIPKESHIHYRHHMPSIRNWLAAHPD